MLLLVLLCLVIRSATILGTLKDDILNTICSNILFFILFFILLHLFVLTFSYFLFGKQLINYPYTACFYKIWNITKETLKKNKTLINTVSNRSILHLCSGRKPGCNKSGWRPRGMQLPCSGYLWSEWVNWIKPREYVHREQFHDLLCYIC